MAFKSNGSIIVTDGRAFDNIANLTIQNGGNLTITSSDTFQGTVAGYSSGGGGNPIALNTIDKFPFATDTNASDVGDLQLPVGLATGHSSSTHGYTTQGFDFNKIPTGKYHFNDIQKFSFASGGNSVFSGNAASYRSRNGAGNSSTTHGYVTGGVSPAFRNDINKFSFASDSDGISIGKLSTLGGYGQANQNSTTNGYLASASPTGGSTRSNTIEKFPFSVDTNTSDVGDLTSSLLFATGQSSTVNGYTSGGIDAIGNINTIDKFPFATDTNASDVGDLTTQIRFAAGQSSTTHGYVSGGRTTPGTDVTTIQKFPFATDTNATNIGDLTQARFITSGQQD